MKRSSLFFGALLGLTIFRTNPHVVLAQWRYLKNHVDVHRAFVPAIADVSKSTVQLESDDAQVALGAIIDPAGLVITKASELKGEIRCRFSNGEVFPARVLVRNAPHDLALLHVEDAEAHLCIPIAWKNEKPTPVGSWLVTPGIENQPLSVGIVSVRSRAIPHERGFLGVRLGQANRGPTIETVFPETAGDLAGLQSGDVVLQLDGKPVTRRAELMERLAATMPAQTIRLLILRGQNKREVVARMGRPDGIDALETRFGIMNEMGGELSLRRGDFPSAFAHDTVLAPEQCGGPVVDIDGKVVGINIARAGRTCSYAIPATVVERLVEQWKGKPEHQVFFETPEAP